MSALGGRASSPRSPGGRHRNQPFLVAERAQALRDAPVPRHPGEAQSDMWQMHDPQARLAIAQDELCLAGRGLWVVAGRGPWPPVRSGCDTWP